MEELYNRPLDAVTGRIREAARRGALSHALLFTGSGDRLSAARYAAAAMECTAEGGQPCGRCAACHKVAENIHPDVITVEDPDHKNISVDVIREMRSDAYIRPNEGRRKIYLFPDCSRLTETDQNVLLKIVEEGPPYASFLFCAENSAAVLQTLRSRCVELKLHPAQGQEDSSEEDDGTAEELCRAIGKGRRGAVTALLVHLERKKTDRESLQRLLGRAHGLFVAALLQLYGKKAADRDREIAAYLGKTLTKTQIMRTIELLQKYHGECAYNVGPNHVLGALAVELEGIL